MQGNRIFDCIKETLKIQPAVLLYCSVSVLTKCAAILLPKREAGMEIGNYAIRVIMDWRVVGIVLLIFFALGLYAFIWQKLIKNAMIAVVYANKSSSILWGQSAAVVIFGEHVACRNLVGLFIIFAGILLVNSSRGVKQ